MQTLSSILDDTARKCLLFVMLHVFLCIVRFPVKFVLGMAISEQLWLIG